MSVADKVMSRNIISANQRVLTAREHVKPDENFFGFASLADTDNHKDFCSLSNA